MSAPGLTINRLRNEYLVDRSGTYTGNDQRRLDRLATQGLAEMLGQALGPLLAERPGLFLLERLECDLTLDAGLPEPAVARLWAAEVARVLSRRLHDDRAQGLASFRDADALLAAFLVDLVEGRAWQGWIYRSFAGLKALPTGAALRTALLGDPEHGLRVLLGMNDQQRGMLIEALGERECERLCRELVPDAGDGAGSPASTVEQILSRVADWSLRFAGRARNTLWYFLKVYRPLEGQARLQLRLVGELVALKKALADSRWRRPANDPEREGEANAIAGYGPLGEGLLARLPLDLQRRLISQLGRDPATDDGAAAPPRDKTGDSLFSLHGGSVLLLRFVAALPLEDCPEIDAQRCIWLRLLILAKAMGQERAMDVFNDPLLRDLLGLEHGPGFTRLRDWVSDVPAEVWNKWLARVGDWRRAQWPADAEDQVLCNRHGLQHLVSEPVKGAWLHSARFASLAELRHHLASMDTGRPPQKARTLRRSLADFKYLRWAPIAAVDENLDLALSVLAQGVMRDLAFCLPGFADSSLEFLNRNFLDFSARMERVGETCQLHLARPPLNVILNMTSLQRGALDLPWRPGPALQLFPDSG